MEKSHIEHTLGKTIPFLRYIQMKHLLESPLANALGRSLIDLKLLLKIQMANLKVCSQNLQNIDSIGLDQAFELSPVMAKNCNNWFQEEHWENIW